MSYTVTPRNFRNIPFATRAIANRAGGFRGQAMAGYTTPINNTRHPSFSTMAIRNVARVNGSNQSMSGYFPSGDDTTDTTGDGTDLTVGPVTVTTPDDNVDNLTSSQGLSSADFKCSGGVCKPANFPALDIVQTLQKQCNRVAQVKGFAKIAADGDVGPGTAALVVKVMAAIGGSPPGSDAASIAPFADILSQQIQAAADAMGAPSSVSGPTPSAPPSITTKSGKTVLAPPPGIGASLADLFNGMSSTQKIVFAGVGAGLLFALMTSTRKKRATARR